MKKMLKIIQKLFSNRQKRYIITISNQNKEKSIFCLQIISEQREIQSVNNDDGIL